MNKRINDKMKKMFIYGIAIVAVSCAFLCLLLNFSYVKGVVISVLTAFKPVAYALIFVFCVSGIVNMYTRLFGGAFSKMKKGALLTKILSVVLGYLTFLVIVAVLIAIVVWTFVETSADILTNIPQYLSDAKGWIRDFLGSVDVLSNQSDKIMNYIDDSLDLSYESIKTYIPSIIGFANKIISEMSSILLGLIISIYIVCSREYLGKIKNRLVHAFLSDEKAEHAHGVTQTVYGYFTDFFSSRLLYSLLIGAAFYVVLYIMGIPTFMAVMIGVLVFIPVVGTVIAFGMSTFFVFIISGEYVLWFIAVFVALLLIGYLVLQKKLIKESVRTTVTASLVSVLVLYGLFGVVGAILAIPVYLSSKLLFKNALDSIEIKKKQKQQAENTDEDDDI